MDHPDGSLQKRTPNPILEEITEEWVQRVFRLQKMLGHSTLEMTRRYANLVTSDLQAVHERVSVLQNAR